MLPIWAPNVHPLIIHFPIGILIVAVFIHVCTLFVKQKWVDNMVNLLYVLGTISAGIAYLTGRDAADHVKFPSEAFPVVSRHADLALWTLCLFTILMVLRIIVRWKKIELILPYRLIMIVLAITASGFLFRTGEFGARLVFGHGVGIYSPELVATEFKPNISGMIYEKNGSWSWKSSSLDTHVLATNFNIKKGLSQQIRTSISQQNNLHQLDISSENSDHIYTTGDELNSMQAFSTFNIDNFDGELILIHHFQDSLNYDYLSIQKNQISLGRFTNGITRKLATETISITNWNTISVVSDGKHFRGYLNDKLILHAHQAPLDRGNTGFGFTGGGTLSLRKISVTSLE